MGLKPGLTPVFAQDGHRDFAIIFALLINGGNRNRAGNRAKNIPSAQEAPAMQRGRQMHHSVPTVRQVHDD